MAGKYAQSFISIVKRKYISKRRKFAMLYNAQLHVYSVNHQERSHIQDTSLDLIYYNKGAKMDNENFLHKSMESKENIHAHSILLSMPNYCKTTVDCKLLLQNNKGITASKEELKLFYNVVHDYLIIRRPFADCKDKIHSSENDKKKLLNMPMQKNISDEGLLKILLLSISPVSADSNFFINYFPIFKVLRKVSTKRLHSWTSDQILLLADIWYLLKYDFSYIHDAVKILGSRLVYLSPSQLVQFFFYLNIIRDNKVSHSLDSFINNILNDINIKELGIVCMGLFKTKTSINDFLVFEKIIKILITNFTSVTDFTLNAILKFVRFNFSKSRPSQKNTELCLYFLNELKPHLQSVKFNTYSLVQIACLGNSYCIYNEDILQIVYNSLFAIGLLPEIRIKDFERLTYVMMNSRIYPKNYPDYSQLIEKEIMDDRRTEEIQLYFHSFLSCVHYLSCIECKLSNTLISQTLKMADFTGVLKDNFYNSKAPSYKRRLQLCQLERTATIDKLDSYEGCRIPKEFMCATIKEHLPRMPNKNMNDLTFQESSLLMVVDLMEKLSFDEKMLVLSYILPHIPFIGIIFCTNEKGEPMKIPESFYSYLPEEIKYPVDSQDLTWNAIIIATKSSYLCNSFILRGDFMVKIMQLQKIGFKVTIVSFCDLTPELEDQKLQNLCNALATSSSLNLLT